MTTARDSIVKAIQRSTNVAFTDNGDITYATTTSEVIDMFGKFGNPQREEDAIATFLAAYEEDPELAVRTLLWSRDARGGAGRRDNFRTVLTTISNMGNMLPVARAVLRKTVELGRWDDILAVTGTPLESEALDMFANGIRNRDGLAAKWAPREKSKRYPGIAKKLAICLGISLKEYRKTVANLSETVEQKMCAQQWTDIDYSHVPSLASARYATAFERHDTVGYHAYLRQLETGEVKAKAGAIYPHQVILGGKAGNDWKFATQQWKALPDYIPENVSFLPLVDVSASMDGSAGKTSATCMDVAIALGIYLAERNKSAFMDSFITFMDTPEFLTIEGPDLHARYSAVKRAPWGGSTNLDRAMNLIVKKAVADDVSPENMPDYLIVLSDMQFDAEVWGGRNVTVAERTRQRFSDAGYEVPNIVWWNLAARNTGNVPVMAFDQGMAMVSGFSPTIMESILSKGTVDPMQSMLNIIMNPRYEV